ncbi:hypothetical protein L484_019352 [Morus notabilis]|uniref:Uncharacterized protein n=1 Tax=Morus notabilis TaxID=981085 RepID=W9QP47_9ROSA|nr:hypothetical protein L484_019352 [Morus notabilis]
MAFMMEFYVGPLMTTTRKAFHHAFVWWDGFDVSHQTDVEARDITLTAIEKVSSTAKLLPSPPPDSAQFSSAVIFSLLFRLAKRFPSSTNQNCGLLPNSTVSRTNPETNPVF